MPDVLSVSALNKYVRSVLESDEMLADIAICGEISNFNRNSKTGHCYFSLKDAKASVRSVLFRSDAENLSFEPENGMVVTVRGRISLYERDGAFQIYVEYMFPQAVAGKAQLAYEQLKEKLLAEGLFEERHKRALPFQPRKIGLVTSKSGAVLHDVLHVAQRRWPFACFVLAAAPVQGPAAETELAAAVKLLDGMAQVDVIIIARGGGSAEDLAVFNSELLARAVYACSTPVVSAVGHETDVTILDFVADLRAPTPSAAAELVLPDADAAMRHMLHVYANIANNMQVRMDSCYNGLQRRARDPAMGHARRLLRRMEERLREVGKRAEVQMAARLARAKVRFSSAGELAGSLNPYAVMARGYAFAMAGERPVRSVDDVHVGSKLCLRLCDGALGCHVETVTRCPRAGAPEDGECEEAEDGAQ